MPGNTMLAGASLGVPSALIVADPAYRSESLVSRLKFLSKWGDLLVGNTRSTVPPATTVQYDRSSTTVPPSSVTIIVSPPLFQIARPLPQYSSESVFEPDPVYSVTSAPGASVNPVGN
jgi:hypothetical protein